MSRAGDALRDQVLGDRNEVVVAALFVVSVSSVPSDVIKLLAVLELCTQPTSEGIPVDFAVCEAAIRLLVPVEIYAYN